ncbi:MAG TPA: hypothetical protein VEZ42_14970 [Pseudonocardia sp.]|nr:hypothetical protein [Pseudonocardia sp.]
MSEQAEDRSDAPGAAPTPVRLADPAVRQFLDGVRAELADLPAAEVDDILDDVRAHLADLADELGPDADRDAVTARLGTPATYAAELRAAAGYPPAPQPADRPRRGGARLAVAALVASTLLIPLGLLGGTPELVLIALLAPLVALPVLLTDGPGLPTVAGLPVVRRFVAARPGRGPVTDFVVALQPAWWLLRALIAAALIAAGTLQGPELVPTVLIALVAVPVSVWLGYRSRRDRRLLWLVVPLNGLAAVMVLVGLLSADPMPASSAAAYGPSGLWQDSEREILDIRPVDASGAPLTGVYLFDQDGQPINTQNDRCSGSTDTWSAGRAEPYPRGIVDVDPRTGNCLTVPPQPLVVAVPPTAGSPATPPLPLPSAAPSSVPVEPVPPTDAVPPAPPAPAPGG